MHRNVSNQKYSAATAKKIYIEIWMKPLIETVMIVHIFRAQNEDKPQQVNRFYALRHNQNRC